MLIFGHEPGGGSQAQCQAGSTTANRTLFFMEPLTGNQIGSLVHVRHQTNTENCTWHNFNVVPTYKGNVAIAGNYQKGISALDFSNPAAPQEIAFADPAPLVHPTNPNSIVLGGDWSTYWYNGRIYESDIRRGLTVWEIDTSCSTARRRDGITTRRRRHRRTSRTSSGRRSTSRRRPGADHERSARSSRYFSCSDAASGVESCVGTVADGAPVNTAGSGPRALHGDGEGQRRQRDDEDGQLQRPAHGRERNGERHGAGEPRALRRPGRELPAVRRRRAPVVRGLDHGERDLDGG